MRKSNIINGRILYLLLLICATTIIFNVVSRAANENLSKQSDTTDNIKIRASGPYCGLHCLYTIMNLTGREVDFKELIKPEYIGSYYGSSLNELKGAAEDYGLYAVPVEKLTNRDLLQSSYPIILHVKFEVESKQYDHYELFLGTENSQAKLFDPPNPVRLVSFTDLAPRWNGVGLIVSDKSIDINAVFAPSRNRFILYVSILIACILALHWAKRWLPESMLNSRGKLLGLSIGQGAAFAIVALLCGMLYHFARDTGLLANAHATASIQQAHVSNFIPKIGERKAHKLLDGNTVFIDARFARDFKAGHLKRAISVPVDANDVERQIATTDIAKDARIVLYCQSASCKFAEKVAIKLKTEGFSNISIFRGGWAEWAAKNGKNKRL